MKKFIKQLRESNAVILDTETTGLDRNAEILQIGICSLDGEALFSSLIKPAKARRWHDAMRVHGIAWSDVQDAPTMGQVSEEIREIIDGRTVAIYNASYDTRLMWQSIRAAGVNRIYGWLNQQTWRCVMEEYAQYWRQPGRYGSYKWQSLSAACRQQGVRVVGAHDALGDALLTAALIRRIEKKLERK